MKAQALQQYEVLFDNASDAIVVIDLKTHKVVAANLQAFELTGYVREELVGCPAASLFPKKESVPGFAKFFENSHIDNPGFYEDLVLRRQDGTNRLVSLSSKTVAMTRGPTAMCILRDVTEKKSLERDLIAKHSELRRAYVELERANADLRSAQDTLVQSGKLAALGELAAGIAHELNQPLTSVAGYTQEALASVRERLCESKNAQPSFVEDERTFLKQVEDQLEEVLGGAQRMEKILSHLRKFTRKTTEDFKWVDLHGVIDEALMLLGKQFDIRGIRLEKNYSKNLPKVFCNPFQMEQVFINLATNARDAIEAKRSGSGRIIIGTEQQGGKMVHVFFEDDGVGIAENTKSKIFNPFFTTKEVGKGMGLGLSITHGILSRIHASIVAESQLGKGTKFTLKIPTDYREH